MVLVAAWASKLIPQLTWFPICSSKSLTTRILMGNTSCRVSNYTTPSLITMEQTPLEDADTHVQNTGREETSTSASPETGDTAMKDSSEFRRNLFGNFSFHCKMAEKVHLVF